MKTLKCHCPSVAAESQNQPNNNDDNSSNTKAGDSLMAVPEPEAVDVISPAEQEVWKQRKLLAKLSLAPELKEALSD